MGASLGVAYGLAAEFAPAVTAGWGLAYRVAVWIGADQSAVPALGLARPPWAQERWVLAYAFWSTALQPKRRGAGSARLCDDGNNSTTR